MRPPASSRVRRWRILAGATALILALVGLTLVPPGTLPYPPKAAYSDSQVSHWPNAYLLRQAVLVQHTWPFWNPSRMLGQPFAANPLSKVWYPPQWLVFLLPPTAHLDLLIYLHLAWLGIGMVTWARSARMRMLTALFMALAWGLNPKLVGHLGAGHLDILYALSWVPWMMWAVRRLVADPGIGNGALLGATLALMSLADLRMSAYFIPVALAYAASLGQGGRWLRSLVPGGGAALATLALLTAVQTIPILALGPYLTRASISPQDAAEFSLSPHYLIGLLLPDVGGPHEWMTYLGLPVIALSGFSLRSQRHRDYALIWWGVIAAAFLWALGSFGPVYLPVVRLLPVLSWLRVPSRAWFVVAFGLIVLSGLGLETVLAGGTGRAGRLFAVAMAFAGLSALVMTALVPGLPGVVVGVAGALLGTGLGLWAMSAAAGGALRAGSARSSRFGAGLLLATLTLSLFGQGLTLVVPRSVTDIERPELAIVSKLDPGCRTVYSPTFEMIGPATISSGIVTLHGVDPFQLRGSAALIAETAGVSLHGYSVIAPPMPPGETDLSRVRPRLDLLRAEGVCDVVSSFRLHISGLEQTAEAGDVAIYRVTDAAGPSASVDAKYTITWLPQALGLSPASTQVCPDTDTSLPTMVAISQSWAPGWQAWLDEQPVAIHSLMDGAFMSVDIDSPGCHTLALAYRPLPDLVGLGISGLTCLVLISGWVVSRRRSRHV